MGSSKFHSFCLFTGKIDEFKIFIILFVSKDTVALACGMSWGGLLLDTFVPFFLAYRPTRMLAFLATMVFHITNKLMLNIGNIT